MPLSILMRCGTNAAVQDEPTCMQGKYHTVGHLKKKDMFDGQKQHSPSQIRELRHDCHTLLAAQNVWSNV